MKLTLNFKELGKNDALIAGGKGASLGEMTQAGIPVPPGFVVLSTTFDQFIKDTDLIQEIDAILDEVNHKDINSVEVASEKIQALIKNAEMPENIAKEIKIQFKNLNTEYVAVRSSATAEDGAENAWAGQLDSYLNTKETNLLEKVQHCWASLFTPRAIFYRFEKGLHNTKISVAVVVQKMVNSEVSGIAFSVHPVTEDRNQMIIEAGFGLGEAIVSGSVTPNSYVIEKDPRRIIDINVSSQTRALYRVESGGNEWINIAEPKASSQVLTEKQILEFANLIMRIENHYGFPCDIEWAFEKGNFYITQSRPITTLSNKKQNNNDKNLWHNWGRWPENVLSNSLWLIFDKKVNEKLGGIITRIRDLDGNYLLFESDVKKLPDFVKNKVENDYKWFEDFFSQANKEVTKLLALEGKNKLSDILKLSVTCVSYSKSMELMDYGLQHYVKNELGKDPMKIFQNAAPYKNTHIMNYEKDLSLLKNEKGVPNLLKKHAWVGTHGFKGEPLTKEKVLEALKTNKKKDKVSNKKNDKFELLMSKLSYFRSYLVESVDKVTFSYWDSIESIAKKYNLTKDEILLLTFEEIINLENTGILPVDYLQRKDKFGIINDVGVMEVVTGEKLETLLKECVVDNGETKYSDELKGSIAYSGKVTGVVRIMRNSKDIIKINEGDILVATETTPDYIQGMKRAGAIVTNQGGITSHAAIVARELKKPCIIGTKNATQVLKDGDMVEVDADKGIIRIIQSGPVSVEKENWFNNASFKTELLAESFIHAGYRKSFSKLLPFLSQIKNRMIISNKIYIDLNEVNRLNDILSKNTLRVCSKAYSVIKKQSYKLKKVAKEITKGNISSISSTELSKRVGKFFEEFQNTIGLIMLPALVDQVTELKVTDALHESSVSDFYGSLSKIAIPSEEVELMKERKELLKIAVGIKNKKTKIDSKIFKKSVHNHFVKYGWIHATLFAGSDYTEGEIISDINKLVLNSKEELDKIILARKNDILSAKEVISKIKFKEGKTMAKFMQVAVYFRTARLEWMNQACFSAKPIITEAAKRMNVSIDDFIYFMPEEIISILSSGKPADKSILAQIAIRRSGYALISDNTNERLLITGTELKSWEDKFIPKADSNQIKGITAYKGVVKGKAIILKDRSELHKAKEGDIIVTPMTTPDFIVVMKMAAAIVTDLGGITSHAAIVSRELGIPCVVGTKIATQIIKDGDMVEVDADKGIVKILNK